MQPDRPEDFEKILNGEKADFVLKAKRRYPLSLSLQLIIGGIIFIAVMIGVLYLLSSPYAKVTNLELIRVFFWIFLASAVFTFLGGVHHLVVSGDWFIGTPTRLICIRSHVVTSIIWGQFNGDLTLQAGTLSNLTILLRRNQNNGITALLDASDVVMLGIKDGPRVEQICRQRIKETNLKPT